MTLHFFSDDRIWLRVAVTICNLLITCHLSFQNWIDITSFKEDLSVKIWCFINCIRYGKVKKIAWSPVTTRSRTVKLTKEQLQLSYLCHVRFSVKKTFNCSMVHISLTLNDFKFRNNLNDSNWTYLDLFLHQSHASFF